MATRQQNHVVKRALDEASKARTEVRLDAWRSVFEKADRILCGKAINVKIVAKETIPSSMTDIPGWSDGETIHFNGPKVIDMLNTKDALAAVLRLKGLNYHELSHVLFTPRQSEELPRRVIERAKYDNDPTWWYAMNALQDQRIETWFTASYRPSRRYYEATVLQWILTDGNAEAGVLLHGRKYLSPKIRVRAEKVFRKKYPGDLYDRFCAVIDQYLTVVLPKDSVRALSLVGKYRTLLQERWIVLGRPAIRLEVESLGDV